MRNLDHRLRLLEFRRPPSGGRIIVAHLEPGESRAEALEREKVKRPAVHIGRVIWIIRDDSRRPDPDGERDALPLPEACCS